LDVFVGGWHPINLLSVAYEIIAKAISLWVWDISRKIVLREEIGFVQGHFILDTLISTWELIVLKIVTRFGLHNYLCTCISMYFM